MTIPCTQETAINRIEQKLDKLTEVVTEVAVQRSDITHLEQSVANLNTRVTKIEEQPAGWLKSIVIALVAAILAAIGARF